MIPIPVFETITLFTDRFADCREFYLSSLEMPLIFEDDVSAVFDFNGVMVNLLEISQADGLVSPHAARGNSGGVSALFTLLVDDCDRYCEALAGRGVLLLNGPVDRTWGRRTAAFADPAGHVWEIAQKLVAENDA